MNPNFNPCLLLPILCLGCGSADGQVAYSKIGYFDESTGYIQSEVNGGWFRGSGVVTRDSQLIYSCGHVFYEDGVWATDYVFHRAYHSSESPYQENGASPRGFRYFSAYSTNVDAYGTASSQAYTQDFTVLYGDAFGPAVGWWDNGAEALKSNRWKNIVGYPSMVDYTGEEGYAYQHNTDWFSQPAESIGAPYYLFEDVSTGGGNSGGPVFVWDDATDDYYLGGILVSGEATVAGVYALNDSSQSMSDAALGLEPITRTFSNTRAAAIPDGKSSYMTRSVQVSGFNGNVDQLRFSIAIKTPRRGDLDVYLKSPSGRIQWVSKKSGSRASGLRLNNTDYSATFKGAAANGNWQLRVRDSVRGNRARLNQFSITVTGLAE
jgi:subtilisin-like proprotein convertase family protein/V8-like Glu-specific endopeptidase